MHPLPTDDATAERVRVAPQGPLGSPAPRGPRVEPRGARAGHNRALRGAQAVPGGEAHRTKMGGAHAGHAPEGLIEPTDSWGPLGAHVVAAKGARGARVGGGVTVRTLPTSSSLLPCSPAGARWVVVRWSCRPLPHHHHRSHAPYHRLPCYHLLHAVPCSPLLRHHLRSHRPPCRRHLPCCHLHHSSITSTCLLAHPPVIWHHHRLMVWHRHRRLSQPGPALAPSYSTVSPVAAVASRGAGPCSAAARRSTRACTRRASALLASSSTCW